MKLLPFQKEFLKAVENPKYDTVAISGPRTLGKTSRVHSGSGFNPLHDADGYLDTHCQITSLAAWPEPSELPESLQPGTYLVGRDIAAGTYREENWARLNGVKPKRCRHNATGGPFYWC